MALSKGQRASRTQEARGAKMHGGTVTPRSGAGWAVKGDVRQPSTGVPFQAALIEFKYTGRKQYTIKAAELEKNVYEAIADGRQPAFGIELNGLRYVIVPEDLYLELREDARPTRTCSVCREDKPLDTENYCLSNGKYHYTCRPCARIRTRAWQLANKDRVKEHQRAATAARRNYVNEIKARPCADCGQQYPPYVMDFDHLEGEEKAANVSAMCAGRSSLEVLDAEIAKCEVVCANCHRIRTHMRRQHLAS